MSLEVARDNSSKVAPGTAPQLVNDVVIQVATSNGTGSQSANLILMRSIFNMGIPVGAKNMFPSNIQRDSLEQQSRVPSVSFVSVVSRRALRVSIFQRPGLNRSQTVQ